MSKISNAQKMFCLAHGHIKAPKMGLCPIIKWKIRLVLVGIYKFRIIYNFWIVIKSRRIYFCIWKTKKRVKKKSYTNQWIV